MDCKSEVFVVAVVMANKERLAEPAVAGKIVVSIFCVKANGVVA